MTAHEPNGAGAPAAADLSAVLAELGAMRAAMQAQADRLAKQEAELAQLRAEASPPETAATPIADRALILPERADDRRASRRTVLGRAAAAAAALGLAGAATGTVSAQTGPGNKAVQVTGGALTLGTINSANLGNFTEITNPTTASEGLIFLSVNSPTLVNTTPFTAGQKVALAGLDQYAAVLGEQHIAVYGRAAGGLGVVAEGLWPLRIVPGATAAVPVALDPAGNAAPTGVLYYQPATTDGSGNPVAGALWASQAVSTSSVAFRRVATGDDAGVIVLINPTRVVDTRAPSAGAGVVTTGYDGTTGAQIAAAPIAAGTTRRFQIDGKSFPQGAGSFTFPADVRGILANVTVIQPSASGGFVTVFPGYVSDANRPNASTVNPSTAISANFTAVAISPNAALGLPAYGTVAVYSTNTADVAIDVVGYFI